MEGISVSVGPTFLILYLVFRILFTSLRFDSFIITFLESTLPDLRREIEKDIDFFKYIRNCVFKIHLTILDTPVVNAVRFPGIFATVMKAAYLVYH